MKVTVDLIVLKCLIKKTNNHDFQRTGTIYKEELR